MVKGEARRSTRERQRKTYELIFDHLKLNQSDVDDVVSMLFKHDIALSRESVYFYIQRIKSHVEIDTKKVKINSGYKLVYFINNNNTLDATVIAPNKIIKKRARCIDDYYVVFNPPRSPLINKLFGLAA